jgi:hypothetical protein
MSNYIPIEFPKWVGGVLVQNGGEERALRAMLSEAAEVPRAVEPTRPPSPAAIRMQRTRERRREGRMSVRCDISTDQIQALVSAGLIEPAMRDDATEVALGVVRAMDRLTRQSQYPFRGKPDNHTRGVVGSGRQNAEPMVRAPDPEIVSTCFSFPPRRSSR